VVHATRQPLARSSLLDSPLSSSLFSQRCVVRPCASRCAAFTLACALHFSCQPLPWPAPCTFPVNRVEHCLYMHVPLRLAESKASCETRLCPSALALLATRHPHAHAFATPSRLAWSWANGVGKGFPVSHGAPCHRRARDQESKMSAVTPRALAAEGIEQRFFSLACDRSRSAPPDQS